MMRAWTLQKTVHKFLTSILSNQPWLSWVVWYIKKLSPLYLECSSLLVSEKAPFQSLKENPSLSMEWLAEVIKSKEWFYSKDWVKR